MCTPPARAPEALRQTRGWRRSWWSCRLCGFPVSGRPALSDGLTQGREEDLSRGGEKKKKKKVGELHHGCKIPHILKMCEESSCTSVINGNTRNLLNNIAYTRMYKNNKSTLHHTNRGLSSIESSVLIHSSWLLHRFQSSFTHFFSHLYWWTRNILSTGWFGGSKVQAQTDGKHWRECACSAKCSKVFRAPRTCVKLYLSNDTFHQTQTHWVPS